MGIIQISGSHGQHPYMLRAVQGLIDNYILQRLRVENPIITYRDLWNNGLQNSLTDNKLKDFLKRYLEVHV